MNVLVVDDFSGMRNVLKQILRQIGFINVLEAEDGAKALEIIKNNNVGVAFVDWQMPNMNGFELLKAVRADESINKLPFIIVTAHGQKEKIISAYQEGVSCFIVKPFTAKTVKEKLEVVFSRKN